jgi:hypothetical protein
MQFSCLGKSIGYVVIPIHKRWNIGIVSIVNLGNTLILATRYFDICQWNWIGHHQFPHALNMQGMKIVGFHTGMFMHGLMRSLNQSHFVGYIKGPNIMYCVCNPNNYYFNYLFMSILCSKIKFEFDINNDELLKTIILEQMREIKPGTKGGGIIKLINLHLLKHYSYLFLTFSKWSFKCNSKIYLSIR